MMLSYAYQQIPVARSRRWPQQAILMAFFAFLSILLLYASLMPICLFLDSQQNNEAQNFPIASQNKPKTAFYATAIEPFCAAADKEATGWGHLTDQECKNRFLKHQCDSLALIRENSTKGLLFFKHFHKAGGTTLCRLAQQNMNAEDVNIPSRNDWTTNCVPYEAFLGPHPAVGELGNAAASAQKLAGTWLGGACFFGFLTPPQLRVLPHHYRPLAFVASEGPMPDVLPLDINYSMVTMLRNPLDRVISSYKWWQFMLKAMPHSPTECRAYWVPSNNSTSLQKWLRWYPDNWVTRELAGKSKLYQKDPLTDADVVKAKQRLHYFAAVLIMERPEGSQRLLKDVFGWRDVDLAEHRAGSNRNSSAATELAMQPETMMLLRELNRHDLEVYEYALQLHEMQVATVAAAGEEENVFVI